MVFERARSVLREGTKVLVIVTGFYFLQGQIFQIRYDMYGSTSGLAHAQARTHTELGDTQDYVASVLGESTLELTRAKRALENSVRDLQREKRELAELIRKRTRELESTLSVELERDRAEVESVRSAVRANVARLETLHASLARDPDTMKRSMLLPTLQLRGNGTVGSGVMIYSERQPDVGDGDVYTTLALTAYHVVSEVLGGRIDRELDEVRALDPMGSDTMETHDAKVVLYDRDRDVALLRLNTTRRFPHLAQLVAPADLEQLDVFSPAYAVGCPLGNRPLQTLGEISSKTKEVNRQVFWMLNAPTFFGNSGGGIYESPGCRLIGVSSMIYTYGKQHPTVVPHMGLFVPLDSISRWLEEEGYAFVLERRPIPGRLLWKVAYVPGAPSVAESTPDARPAPASASAGASSTGAAAGAPPKR